MSSIVAGITKDLKAVPENLKAKAKGADFSCEPDRFRSDRWFTAHDRADLIFFTDRCNGSRSNADPLVSVAYCMD